MLDTLTRPINLGSRCLSWSKRFAINEKNGNTCWRDAIQKEIENVKITFQTIPYGEKLQNGFLYVNCNMVLVIKMGDFHRKACLVAGGHMTHKPDFITYLTVVKGETVCIPPTMAA